MSTPVAFFASFGGGYLSPLGYTISTLVLAQIVATTGYGQFFPWAIPAVISGVTGDTQLTFGSVSFIIVFLTSFLGIMATMLWWKYADQD